MTSKSCFIGLFLMLPIAAITQDGSGVIRGSMFGPEGESVPYLWVQATHEASDTRVRAEGTVDGTYEISGLEPGTYTLEINPRCCAYDYYESIPIDIPSGEPADFDIHLKPADLNTIGDDPGILLAGMRSENDVADASAPRAPWGAPDISGTWLIDNDPFPEDAQPFDWAQKLFDDRVANHFADDPLAKCLPTEATVNFVTKVVQTEDLVLFLFESYPGFRQVFLDGRQHPEYPNPSWMGHSIGYWEGDTLVVDTVGFNDRGWMWVYPRSEELHIVERFTRTSLARMDVEITVEDPKVFEAPLARNRPAYFAPQQDVLEYVCENNKW